MLLKRLFSILLILSLVVASDPAFAAKKKQVRSKQDPRKYASLVVHLPSGQVIQEQNSSKTRYPASLTKLMTLYLTFEALESGKLTMERSLPVSLHASRQPSMKIGLRNWQKIKVKEAIASLVVRSANDSSVVLAEAVAGSEKRFAEIMTARAGELGMTNTRFKNASGLFHPGQVTTAKDMARLMIAIERDFPQYFNLLSQVKFRYAGREFKTHNHIMLNYKGAIAGKTGYVNASGYNLVTTARRGDKEIVAVVMGGRTAKSRDMAMRTLLDQSFGGSKKSTTRVSSDKKRTPTNKKQKSGAELVRKESFADLTSIDSAATPAIY